jgi:RNA-binding protein 26
MCRDYHSKPLKYHPSFLIPFFLDKGYCARGALCNYSHGEDAIAPPNSIWMNPAAFNPMMHGMPLLPMVMPFGMPQPNPDGSYDPNESRLDVANGMMPMLFPQPQLSQDADVVMKDGNTVPSEQTPGISRPDFTSNLKSKSKPRRSSEDKTLVVEKIPTEHLQLQALTDWFSRFGSVTNVAIDSKGGKALVSFSSNDEAYKAWKSQDAVFNNRFVKVYWHHPIEGQGLRGKQALAASAGVVKDLTTKPDMPSLPSQASGTVEAPRATADAQPAPPTKSLTNAQRDALEKNIAQQKVLFSRLKSAQGEDKKQLLAEIRALSEAMEAADKLVAPKETAPIVSESTAPIDQADKLDKELDLQQAVQELTRRAQDPNEDHAAIRVEMERLIAKV